ncbi:MAG: hypothetical protein QXS54_10665, partial [Candidatus Methanomethylicaceae archaeon]
MGDGVIGALDALQIVCGIYREIVTVKTMKNNKQFLLIILSGITTSLAFPPVNWNLFLFFAPALGWRYAIGDNPRVSALRMAIWGGTFATMLGWHAIPTLTQQSMSFGLCAILIMIMWTGLWHSIWGWITNMFAHKLVQFILISSSFWTSIAWLRSLGTLGFPWGMLSLALTDCPILLQPSDIGGIWFVEWLVVAWNTGLAVMTRQRKLSIL